LPLFSRRNPTELERKLGYVFRNPGLLDTALTHISYANERGRQLEHNEKFEFLGDSVLGFVITDMLMLRFTGCDEGEMSKMRAVIVSRRILAQIAYQLKLGNYLKLSLSEENSGGREKESIMANSYEALIAAIYFDGGLKKVRKIIERHFEEPIKAVEEGRCEFEDYKSNLQEIAQNRFRTTPSYKIIRETGPDHAKRFFAVVSVDNKKFGVGRGRSKKEAEQDAARQTLIMLSFKKEQDRDEKKRGAEQVPSDGSEYREDVELARGGEKPESRGVGKHWLRRAFGKLFRRA